MEFFQEFSLLLHNSSFFSMKRRKSFFFSNYIIIIDSNFVSIFNSISSRNIRFSSFVKFFFVIVHSSIHKLIYLFVGKILFFICSKKKIRAKGSTCITAFSLKIINEIHDFHPKKKKIETKVQDNDFYLYSSDA